MFVGKLTSPFVLCAVILWSGCEEPGLHRGDADLGPRGPDADVSEADADLPGPVGCAPGVPVSLLRFELDDRPNLVLPVGDRLLARVVISDRQVEQYVLSICGEDRPVLASTTEPPILLNDGKIVVEICDGELDSSKISRFDMETGELVDPPLLEGIRCESMVDTAAGLVGIRASSTAESDHVVVRPDLDDLAIPFEVHPLESPVGELVALPGLDVALALDQEPSFFSPAQLWSLDLVGWDMEMLAPRGVSYKVLPDPRQILWQDSLNRFVLIDVQRGDSRNITEATPLRHQCDTTADGAFLLVLSDCGALQDVWDLSSASVVEHPDCTRDRGPLILSDGSVGLARTTDREGRLTWIRWEPSTDDETVLFESISDRAWFEDLGDALAAVDVRPDSLGEGPLRVVPFDDGEVWQEAERAGTGYLRLAGDLIVTVLNRERRSIELESGDPSSQDLGQLVLLDTTGGEFLVLDEDVRFQPRPQHHEGKIVYWGVDESAEVLELRSVELP